MLRILLILSAISGALFLLFGLKGWLGQLGQRQQSSDSPTRAYFWGLAFAMLFHYGFPLWWWRYGLLNAFKLMFICVVSVVAVQTILREIGAIEVDGLGESIFAGLLIAIPIRVIAGFWVANNDARWRSAILLKRKGQFHRADA